MCAQNTSVEPECSPKVKIGTAFVPFELWKHQCSGTKTGIAVCQDIRVAMQRREREFGILYHIDFAVEHLLTGQIETSSYRQTRKIHPITQLMSEIEAVCACIDDDEICTVTDIISIHNIPSCGAFFYLGHL